MGTIRTVMVPLPTPTMPTDHHPEKLKIRRRRRPPPAPARSSTASTWHIPHTRPRQSSPLKKFFRNKHMPYPQKTCVEKILEVWKPPWLRQLSWAKASDIFFHSLLLYLYSSFMHCFFTSFFNAVLYRQVILRGTLKEKTHRKWSRKLWVRRRKKVKAHRGVEPLQT